MAKDQPATIADEALPDLARIPDEELREIKSWEDALKFAQNLHGELADASEEIGSGFSPVEDKARYVGEKLLLIDWTFYDGEFGSFVAAHAVTGHNDRIILVDGSSGLMNQLRAYTAESGKNGGLYVPNGLRLSEYDICTGCGIPRPSNVTECEQCGDTKNDRAKGRTFYLDTSK